MFEEQIYNQNLLMLNQAREQTKNIISILEYFIGHFEAKKDNLNRKQSSKNNNQKIINEQENICQLELDNMTYNNIKIIKRNDNRWYARKTINKKTYSIYGKTQQECLNKLKAFIKNPKKKIINKEETNYTKLYEWLEFWLDTYKKPHLKPKSLYEIKGCIKNHIKPHIENIALNKLTALQIELALNKIESSRMKKYTFDCYIESLRQAYKNKLMKEDITPYINKVTNIREKGRSLNKQEREIFLNKTKLLKYGKIFEFQFYSGCRPQGARELKWEYIKENQIYINETKSQNGQRYIPYFDNIKNVLKNIPHTSEYVFPISESTIKEEFKKLKELCGFEFTQKDLRHTFGTICAENNINENTIAKWMGHGSPNTTRQYYIEVLNDFEILETNKVNNSFKFE